MDRLSNLPDSVLAHTLSFLPTKDAVKIAILSKRFENQWTSVPSLSFHGTTSSLQFVNQALALWGGAKSRTLCKFDVEDVTSSAKDVRVWVRFAVDHAVEHLRLVFNNSSWDNSASFFTLPQYLYSNSSIRTIELACCVLTPRTQVRWSRLKKLTIKCVMLSNELIKNVICGSVQLELFEICDCKGYDSLVIDSSSLKILIIRDNFEESSAPVTISAPNITKLCISGVWHRKITLVCVSALVDAEVRFLYRSKIVQPVYGQRDRVFFDFRINEYIEKVIEHLHCHLSTERLVIGAMFIEALTLADVKTLPHQLSKCRSVTLRTNTETNVLKGILNLVKMVPNLEVLILDMEFLDKWYSSGSAVDSFLMSEVEDLVIFQHLKMVKITCHVDRRPVLPFIKFLLEHAQALETVSIFPKTASSYSIDYMFQLIQDLSDIPRSSPVAKVVLCKGHTKIQVQKGIGKAKITRIQ